MDWLCEYHFAFFPNVYQWLIYGADVLFLSIALQFLDSLRYLLYWQRLKKCTRSSRLKLVLAEH